MTEVKMFLIEKAWSDPMENEVSSAFGYEPFAVTGSELEAKEFCNTGGVVGDNFGWAAPVGSPVFRYCEVPVLKRSSQ